MIGSRTLEAAHEVRGSVGRRLRLFAELFLRRSLRQQALVAQALSNMMRAQQQFARMLSS
jgi:hypothetical protein